MIAAPREARHVAIASCSRGRYRRDMDRRRAVVSLAGELWEFMRVRKKWWLAPIMVVLVMFGALIVLTQGSAVAPFIYTIF